MWPDRVSNPGPLTYKAGALPTALHGLAGSFVKIQTNKIKEKKRKDRDTLSNLPIPGQDIPGYRK